MEELEARLAQIKLDMDDLRETTELISKQASILDFFDRINKEVV